MTKRKMDILSALVLGGLAILIHLEARRIPSRVQAGVDSGFFPLIVTALLLILAVAIIVRALRAGAEADGVPSQSGSMSRVWLTCALLAAATFAMEYVGFLVAAAVFLFAQMAVLTPVGKHRFVLNAIVSVGFAVAVYFVFAKGFGVILPEGIL